MTLPEILFTLFVVIFSIWGMYKGVHENKKSIKQMDEMIERVKKRRVLLWIDEHCIDHKINIDGSLSVEELEEMATGLIEFIKDKKKVKND